MPITIFGWTHSKIIIGRKCHSQIRNAEGEADEIRAVFKKDVRFQILDQSNFSSSRRVRRGAFERGVKHTKLEERI